MPANHHIDHDTRIILTTWEGIADDSEFIEALDNYQNNIQNHPDYIDYNEVVDLTHTSSIKITTKGIKKIGTIASKTDQNKPDRKLALIVNSNLAFGLARMYIVYRSFSKNANKNIRVFKNEKNAFEWIQK